jgi:Signal transduction histidine kinase involved in nitrogen fixation and metabolism regulation
MNLNKILVIGFLVMSITPALIVGSLNYISTDNILYELNKKDMEERTDIIKNVAIALDEEVKANNMSEEEAMDLFKRIVGGEKLENGSRDYRKGFYKEGCYPFVRTTKGDIEYVLHPYREGQKLSEIEDEVLKQHIIETIDREKGFKEYLWKNPGETEYYHKIEVWDYYEPRDLQIFMSVNLDDFLAPAKRVRSITFVICLITAVLVSIFSLAFSNKISKPLNKLTMTAAEISSGNFELRVPEFKTYKELERIGDLF